MLRDIPKLIMISFIGVFLIVVCAYFAVNGYEQDSIVQSMTETLRTTAIANRDDSARTQRGQFRLQVEKFETEFKESFELNKNLSIESFEYIFDYLEDGEGGVKAIKVKAMNGDQVYQATCVVNVADE